MAETSKNKIYYNDDENSVADVLTDMKKMAESTDKAIENSRYDDTETKKDILNIQKKQDDSVAEIQEKLENLRNITNVLPTVSEKGENITLNNTAKNVRFRKFKIGGNVKQETRSGKNLLELMEGTYSNNGITAVVKSGVITLNGTATDISFVSVNLLKSLNLITGKTYHLSIFNSKAVGDSSNICALRLNQNGTKQASFDKVNSNLAIDGNFLFSYITVRTPAGITYNNFEIKPQFEIENGTDTWEQGGAMPSIDYTSKIKTVGSNINIFDITKYDYRKFNEASVEITDSTNFRIIATTSKNANNAVGFKVMDLTNYAGKTLTLKAKVKSSTSTNKGFLVLRQNNADYTGTKSNEKYDETQNTTDGVIILQYKVADTINDSNRYLFAWFFATRGSDCNANDYVDYKVKIAEGAEVGEYSQYAQGSSKAIIENSDKTQKQEYIIPVQNEILEGDYFDWNNEEEVHGWKKIILNGTENWQLYSAGTNISRRFGLALTENVPLKETEKYGKGYSTHFEITQFINGDLSIFLQVESNNWYIAVTDVNSRWSSIVEFKSWLKAKYAAGTPVIIYYKTAAETRIPFTDEQKAVAKEIQKATSYEDTTHIYSTDEVSPVFDVEAVINLKKLIANTSTTAEGEN